MSELCKFVQHNDTVIYVTKRQWVEDYGQNPVTWDSAVGHYIEFAHFERLKQLINDLRLASETEAGRALVAQLRTALNGGD